MLVYLEEGELTSESGAPVTPGECANPGCTSFLPYRVRDASHMPCLELSSSFIPPSCPVPLTLLGTPTFLQDSRMAPTFPCRTSCSRDQCPRAWPPRPARWRSGSARRHGEPCAMLFAVINIKMAAAWRVPCGCHSSWYPEGSGTPPAPCTQIVLLLLLPPPPLTAWGSHAQNSRPAAAPPTAATSFTGARTRLDAPSARSTRLPPTSCRTATARCASSPARCLSRRSRPRPPRKGRASASPQVRAAWGSAFRTCSLLLHRWRPAVQPFWQSWYT